MLQRRPCIALALAASALVLVPRTSSAQNKPFPQNGGYANGFLPSSIAASDALSAYNSWKKNYLKSDCGKGYYRVEFGSPAGTTVSEGMGYGMVLTAYFGDKTAFDGLWKFVQKNFNSDGLMGWNVTCQGFNQNVNGPDGSATDGDTDIGLALVAAVDQWGDSYRPIALSYLANLKKVEFASCTPSGRIMATAGNWGGGCDFSNSSYWMPGYYRVFQEFAGDASWGKTADDVVALYMLNRNRTTGLLGNEVDQNGMTYNGEAYVDYNGCRTPWRAVLDYLWYGTANAKDETDKITDWANSVGISKLLDGYNTDGTPSSNAQYTQQNPWVGGFACGAMSKSQAVVDAFGADFKSIADDEGGYYGSSLRSLYLLMLSGNFWKPNSLSGGAPDAGAVSSTPAADAGAGSGGGTGGGTGGGGNGGSNAGSGAVRDGSDGGSGAAAGFGGGAQAGCGCTTSRMDDAAGGWVLAGGVVLLMKRRRRHPPSGG